MSPSEVASLFVMLSFFDNRHQADEGKILAWHQTLLPEMDLPFAKTFISKHYGKTEAMIQPSHFNNEWRRIRNDARDRGLTKNFFAELENHKKNVVSPEEVSKIVLEIRQNLRRVKNASLEVDSEQVAPDL